MKTEWKIGEIKQVNDEWYQCVEGNDCENCAFNERKCYTVVDNDDPIGDCCADRRKDNKDVIFKKLEKVEEPYERNGCMYQEYKAYTYPLLMSGDAKIPTNNGFAAIIKQNKEDMEESKLNLKPFDIQKAKDGKPVCTRDGCKVRIISFDREFIYDGQNYCIVALVSEAPHNEVVYSYTKDGLYNPGKIHERDLMMLSEKKSGWILLRKDTELYNSEEAAKNICTNDNRIPVKVEFEI